MAEDTQSQPREIELSFEEEDVIALRAALGVNELEEENARLRQLLSDALTYQNLMDRRLQRLEGEQTVTEDLEAHVTPGGALAWERRRPAVPENLTDFLPGANQKLPIEEGN